MSIKQEKIQLRSLEPVKFPDRKAGKARIIYKTESTTGKSTKEVIAEMKRLSKKGIYVSE